MYLLNTIGYLPVYLCLPELLVSSGYYNPVVWMKQLPVLVLMRCWKMGWYQVMKLISFHTSTMVNTSHLLSWGNVSTAAM